VAIGASGSSTADKEAPSAQEASDSPPVDEAEEVSSEPEADSDLDASLTCGELVPADAENYNDEFQTCVAGPSFYEYEEPEPELPEANPSGDYTSECDVLIPNDDGPYRYVATARLKNNGNVGLVMNVTAWAEQVGAPRLKWVKTVKLPVGAKKRVDFDVALTEDQDDRYFAGDLDCGVKAGYVNTFGAPQ
jgi:hypothetical protein